MSEELNRYTPRIESIAPQQRATPASPAQINAQVNVVGKCVRCDSPISQDEHGCLDEAMGGTISGGYGSRNDVCEFTAFICDDCAHAVAPIMRSRLEISGVHEPCSREVYNAWVKAGWDEDGNPRTRENHRLQDAWDAYRAMAEITKAVEQKV